MSSPSISAARSSERRNRSREARTATVCPARRSAEAMLLGEHPGEADDLGTDPPIIEEPRAMGQQNLALGTDVNDSRDLTGTRGDQCTTARPEHSRLGEPHPHITVAQGQAECLFHR